MKKQSKKIKVEVVKSIDYDRLRCLLIAAYLIGQESGLRGIGYNHPIAQNQKENLIHLLFNGKI